MPSKLLEFEIIKPGLWGVNTSASADIMPKEYAIKAENIVFSEDGYPESRRGSRNTHTNSLSTISGSGAPETIKSIKGVHTKGTHYIFASTDNNIYRTTGVGVEPTLVTGTITAPTAGKWSFLSLLNETYAFQPGHKMIVCNPTNTGTFADVTFSGTYAPTGDGVNIIDAVITAGRLWYLEGTSLRYSTLLSPTDFNDTTAGGNAGEFNLASVMLDGTDNPTALAEFNGNLLVFTQHSVIVYSGLYNPNALSTNPSPPMQVVENIGGVGCVAKDSIQYTKSDLLFLSDYGVASLSRVIQEKSMPTSLHTNNIRKDVLTFLKSVTPASIWSAYLKPLGIYLIGSPEQDKVFTIDTSGVLPDGSFRATTWKKTVYAMEDLSQEQSIGTVDAWSQLLISEGGDYLRDVRGYKDGASINNTGGTDYTLEYESAWTTIIEDFENYTKMPKKIGLVLKGRGTVTYKVNIAYDYNDYVESRERTGVAKLSTSSYYGQAKYGVDVYATPGQIKKRYASGFGSGRIMKVRVRLPVNGNAVSLQRISILAKIGKQR